MRCKLLLQVIVAVLLTAALLPAAATFDVASSKNGGTNNVTQLVWSHTVTAGLTNVCLLVAYNGRGTISSVDYNGHALTILTSVTNTTRAELWVLNPVPVDSIGSALNITVNVSSSRSFAGAISVSGAGTVGTPATNTLASSTPTVVVNSNAGDLVFGSMALNINSNTPTNLQTGDWAGNTGGTGGSGSAGEHTTGSAGTTTLGWTTGGSTYASVGVSVPAFTSPPATKRLSALGVGE